MREYGFWYLDDPALAPDGQIEKGLEAFLTEADLLEREGIEPDVVEACLWVALARLIVKHEGEEGLEEFCRELSPSRPRDPSASG